MSFVNMKCGRPWPATGNDSDGQFTKKKEKGGGGKKISSFVGRGGFDKRIR